MTDAKYILFFKVFHFGFCQTKFVAIYDPEHNVETVFEPRHEKTNVLVSDLVQHKPGCTATEDG